MEPMDILTTPSVKTERIDIAKMPMKTIITVLSTAQRGLKCFFQTVAFLCKSSSGFA